MEIVSLTADNLSTGYSEKEVLDNINFDITTTGIYVVFGKTDRVNNPFQSNYGAAETI